MTFRELCAKEVVQLSNGACLGKADDLELDPQTAQIQSLQLLGRPRFFGLLGLCGNDRRFHAESSSDKIRLSRWRPSWNGGFGRLRLLVRFRNIGFVDFRRIHRRLLVIEQQLVLLALHDGIPAADILVFVLCLLYTSDAADE